MELTRRSLVEDRNEWIEKGYELPEFDYEAVKENTKKAPVWIHFGAGNIFKAFQCNLVQKLLNKGIMDKGVIAAEGYDYEIVEKMSWPHDDLTVLATLKAQGSIEKTVVGSIVESLILDRDNKEQYERLCEIFSNPSLQMASFTITEKGYALTDAKGNVLPAIAADYEKGPDCASSYLGKVASLLYVRFKAGELPVSMVSMDNCSHNGDKLRLAMQTIAEKWVENGKAEPEFAAYLKNEAKVAFPWTMIDKITPRPNKDVEILLDKDGIHGLEPVITGKNTYIAPFVNAEECEYLVIEDAFPNGHPDLTPAGVIFTTKETVDKVEKMKVCTCLNPLHTCLAVFGCVLGYELISKEMKDDALRTLVEKIGYVEGLPVVVNPGILDPKKFIDEVVNVRIPNPFMPDSPQRIATDTSQKLAIRYGETIKAYERDEKLDVKSIKYIPMVFAGWLRYLMAVDDNGNTFERSADPLLDAVTPYIKDITLGYTGDVHEKVAPILSNEKIFGLNLYEAGLGELTEEYFASMIKGKGAVRETLNRVVGK